MAKTRDSDELTAEQKKSILDDRAALYAQALASVVRKDNQLDLLEVIISGERFAFEARFVREASKLFALTPLPCTPDFVLGLINFRGQILPVLDLRRILELPASTSPGSQVVVIQTSTASAGIAVDEIAGICSIAEAELQSPEQLVHPLLEPLFRGLSGDRLAVLNVEALFSDPRLIVESRP